MNEVEKIKALISSRTKENNYLAICLMIEVLELDFETAFLKLQLAEELPGHFIIEVANLRLLYELELFKAIDVPSDWGYLNRAVSEWKKHSST